LCLPSLSFYNCCESQQRLARERAHLRSGVTFRAEEDRPDLVSTSLGKMCNLVTSSGLYWVGTVTQDLGGQRTEETSPWQLLTLPLFGRSSSGAGRKGRNFQSHVRADDLPCPSSKQPKRERQSWDKLEPI
jgi:hypothetical protein